MSKARRFEFLERLANLLQEYNAEIEIHTNENTQTSLAINLYGEQIYESCSLKFNGSDIKRCIY